MKSSIQIKKIGQNVVSIEYQQIKNLVGKIDDNYIGIIHLHDIIKEGIVE